MIKKKREEARLKETTPKPTGPTPTGPTPTGPTTEIKTPPSQKNNKEGTGFSVFGIQ